MKYTWTCGSYPGHYTLIFIYMSGPTLVICKRGMEENPDPDLEACWRTKEGVLRLDENNATWRTHVA